MHRRPLPRAPFFLAAALVLLAGTFLRVWALAETDIGLHYDEAAMLLLSRDIASGASFPVFIRAFTGQEVAFHYIAALVLKFGGDSVFAMRLAAAAIGIVTVAATLTAARALFASWRDADWIALLAAVGMAVAFPHVLFSRYGFRVIAQPMFQALAIAALWIGLRTGKLRWLIAGGAWVGLTGHTYLAARLFPLPLVVALIWWLACVRSRRAARNVAIVALCAAITFAPLAIFFVQNPDTFSVRISQVASPTAQEAMRGVEKVIKAFGLPGQGDPYIRFNLPGRPMLDLASAVLALIGLTVLLTRRIPDAAGSAGRVLVVAGVALMPLASALATSEITPSNLRLLGVYPFVVMLPALGLVELLARLPRREFTFPLAFAAALILGVFGTRQTYAQWAASGELFAENHGEMVLAARALDELARDGRAIYIASEHYQHPSVAALARNYGKAKWLTGGATIVLPAQGDATYFVPVKLPPPGSWPEALTSRWTTEARRGPDGSIALRIHTLAAADIAMIRASLPATPTANFAYVVGVRDARPLTSCRAGEECPILVQWDIRAPYAHLQPVARIFHPLTGEWGRTNPFHYPTAEWTVGETVLDQLKIPIAPGAPPVDGYRLGVGFFNPETRDILPRLNDADRFAGIEADYTLGMVERSTGPWPDPPAAACREDSRANEAHPTANPALLAWAPFEMQRRPGERLALELCWLAIPETPALGNASITVQLSSPDATYALYAAPPVSGTFPFGRWQAGQVVRDRYAVRVPRNAAPGRYALEVRIGGQPVAARGEVEVMRLERDFAQPAPARPIEATLGDRAVLLGIDLGEARAGEPLSVKLYWRALSEMDEDYTAFVHVIDPSTGKLVAQSDAMPRGGAYPTSLWARGEVVGDEHRIQLPADLAPGEYALRAGLYVPSTGEHLNVGKDDGADLGRVRVVAPG